MLSKQPDPEEQITAAEEPVGVAEGPKKPRLRWYYKVLIVLASVALVGSGCAVAVGYWLSNRYESYATHEPIIDDSIRNQEPPTADGPLNFMVLGTDSRADEATEQLDSTGSRSDTIMLVHVAKGRHSAFVLSIPRDSWVDVPASGSWKGGKNKINAAFSYGGAALAAKTIYNLAKVPLDGAVIINFAGVRNMVDAVDGVHVCPPYNVPNYFKYEFPQYNAGWQKGKCYDMHGEEAEVFVRQRHDVPGGDFGRIRSQQLVMMALADKATSAGMIANPFKLDNLLLSAAKSLTIDESMNLRDLAFELKGISPSAIKFATVPYTGTATINGASTVQLNLPASEVLFQAIRDDKTDAWLAAHPQPEVASYGPNT